tara:strand:- start:26706 stop:27074 length:369 start_codon:yes stop_codon:yes gene_type:complete
MSGLYYLEYHDAAKNSHKFYAGNPQTGHVLYGRIGSTGTLKHYGFKKTVDMKYEKQKKGYKSAPMPMYVEAKLQTQKTFVPKTDSTPKVKPIKVTGVFTKVKPAKVSANRGLLNWFSGIDRL